MEIAKPKDIRHQYEYRPLPKERAIRVLRIDSKPEEEIRVSFEIIDLDTKPTYDCLSYTWAYPQYQALWPDADKRDITDKASILIQCEGKGFLVAENLFEALKQLCKKKWKSPESNEQGHSGENCIWIDAICINQPDNVEKKSQLALMRDIYKGAELVVAWLGPDSDDPGAAKLDSAKEVVERLASVPPEKWDSDLPDDLYDPGIWKILGMEQTLHWEWLAFAGFILRGWFSRIWVVQERWAAKRMVVFCGDWVIDWKVLSDGITTLRATGMDGKLNSKVEEIVSRNSPTGSGTRFVTNRIRNQFIFTAIDRSQPLKLEKLLAYSRYFNATVADDRVYAVLGMWIPSGSLTGQNPTKLLEWAPAKASGPQEIYTKASLVAIQEMGDLNLLSLVEDASSRRLSNLPSWVPDYTVPPVVTPLNGIPRAEEGTGPWNASMGLPWEEPKENGEILQVRGVRIDTIVELATNFSEVKDGHRFCTLLKLLQIALDSNPVHDSGEQFWRALIKDNFYGKPAGDDARRAFPKLITYYVWALHIALTDSQEEASNPDAEPTWREERHKEFKKFESIMSETTELLSKLSTQEENSLIPTWETIQGIIALDPLPVDMDAELERTNACFRSAYMERRLVRTSGNYLGIAPQSVEKGDEIWILAGAFVPMILRREENSERRRLVGEAYINGYMKGETVDAAKMTTLEIV